MAAVTVCSDFGAQEIKSDSYGVRGKFGESCLHLAQDALYLSSRILQSMRILHHLAFGGLGVLKKRIPGCVLQRGWSCGPGFTYLPRQLGELGWVF